MKPNPHTGTPVIRYIFKIVSSFKSMKPNTCISSASG